MTETAQPLLLVATGAAAIGVNFAAGARIAFPATAVGGIPFWDVGNDPLTTVETIGLALPSTLKEGRIGNTFEKFT